MNLKIILCSIIGGVIVTLLTGLILNTPPMLAGATHYGFPFAWLTRLMIAPEHFPWRVNVLNLIADIIILAIIVGIILSFLTKVKK